MRRILASSSMLLIAGCASAPQQATSPQPLAAQQPRQSGSLLGLTPQDLVGEFGTPALQIHEGASLKLQFRGSSCIMDAYLYPSGTAGTLKVTHVDTRLPSGSDVDQAACVSALRRSS
ncbi:MAG TPA: hypothetical protein VJ846_10925 [Sphingomicrobium sp.]|nr:hypothetical protein [Sphingomicrobium sp.]